MQTRFWHGETKELRLESTRLNELSPQNQPPMDPRFITTYTNPSIAVNYIPPGLSTVLDVGCGTGATAKILTERGLEVDGITWNDIEVTEAQKVCRRVYKLDLEHGLPTVPTAAFDIVICSHILEHIAYPEKLLADIHRVLKDQGVIIVAIPNLFFWRDRLKLLAGRWEYEASGTFDYTHLRWYSNSTMRSLLQKSKFHITHNDATGWIPLPGLKWIVGKTARAHINKIFCKLWPGLFGGQLIFSARKAQTVVS